MFTIRVKISGKDIVAIEEDVHNPSRDELFLGMALTSMMRVAAGHQAARTVAQSFSAKSLLRAAIPLIIDSHDDESCEDCENWATCSALVHVLISEEISDALTELMLVKLIGDALQEQEDVDDEVESLFGDFVEGLLDDDEEK